MQISESESLVVDASVPSFDIDLPPGWRRHEVTDDSLRTLLDATRRRCVDSQRLDVFTQFKTMLEDSFADMRRAGVFAYFCPTLAGEETLAIPSSMNATIRKAEPGQSLDSLVRSMISHHGAQPLLGDPRIVRMEREREMNSAEGSVVNHSVVYLTPLPDTHRTRALQLVAVFPRDPAESASSAEVEATRALFDACVSTLRWRPSASVSR